MGSRYRVEEITWISGLAVWIGLLSQQGVLKWISLLGNTCLCDSPPGERAIGRGRAEDYVDVKTRFEPVKDSVGGYIYIRGKGNYV